MPVAKMALHKKLWNAIVVWKFLQGLYILELLGNIYYQQLKKSRISNYVPACVYAPTFLIIYTYTLNYIYIHISNYIIYFYINIYTYMFLSIYFLVRNLYTFKFLIIYVYVFKINDLCLNRAT